MTHLETWLMAVALALDCFAVSVASGIIFKKQVLWPMAAMIFLFGFFQALNPMLGWWGADSFRSVIESFDHWLAFAILAFLGVRMILDSFKEEDEKNMNPNSIKVIFTLAIATSIDALAVGVTFALLPDVNIGAAVGFIGVITFILSAIGIKIGNIFGVKFKSKAEFAGGLILILMGLKILLEHLGVINF
jgi:putative Mn2+ efflux pump MntP